jgi:peptide/nickel transport system ATP-binding protein
VQHGILKLLLWLQKGTNASGAFITPYIAVVKAISDEIVVMQQGRVVEQVPKTECCCHRIMIKPNLLS